MITNFDEYYKIMIGDFVLLSDNIQSLKNPIIYPVGEVIEIRTNNIFKIKVKIYNSKILKDTNWLMCLSDIDKIIKKDECDKYINEWLIKIKAKKYNII
jgi:hypothetical protein